MKKIILMLLLPSLVLYSCVAQGSNDITDEYTSGNAYIILPTVVDRTDKTITIVYFLQQPIMMGFQHKVKNELLSNKAITIATVVSGTISLTVTNTCEQNETQVNNFVASILKRYYNKKTLVVIDPDLYRH